MKDLELLLDTGRQSLKAGVEAIRTGYDNLESAQLETFALSFAMAGLRASECLIKYQDRAQHVVDRDSFELVHGIVGMFIANSVHETLNQVSMLVPNSDFNPSSEAVRLVQRYLSPQEQARLGVLIRDRAPDPLPDLLSDEMSAIRDTLRRFTDASVVPLAQQIHRDNLTIPDVLVDQVRELGCFGLSVPSEYGGSKEPDEQDSLGMVVVTEELSRGSLGAAGSLITRPEIMVRALVEGGTEAQKQRWLPKIASGDPLCAISVTEPGTGSDVASVSLRATRSDGGWLLRGSKTWCTLAGKAGLILVLARTDSDASPPHRGLSLFVIEKPVTEAKSFEYESPGGGMLTGRAIDTLGYRGMHSFEMFFDDFFVPSSCLVGEDQGLNRGFYYTMSGFSAGRLQTAARATGLMQAAFESACNYAADRTIFGKQLESFPLTLAKLAHMAMHIVATRQFSYQVGTIMQTEEGQAEASLVKLLACRSAEWVTREALQIHGGMGYAEESPVSRYFVDARVLSIFEGSEETLALRVVGKRLFDA